MVERTVRERAERHRYWVSPPGCYNPMCLYVGELTFDRAPDREDFIVTDWRCPRCRRITHKAHRVTNPGAEVEVISR